jgi:hypothetical protein
LRGTGRVAPRIRVEPFASGCLAAPVQLIGLINGVMTGVTAGAMGFIGAADVIGLLFAAFLRAGCFFAALRAGFLAAFLEDFFFEDFFLEDFFFAAFFLDVFFFATRFLEDFFLAVFFFAAGFFFADFFLVAMFETPFNVGPIVCRALRPEGGWCTTKRSDFRIERDW